MTKTYTYDKHHCTSTNPEKHIHHHLGGEKKERKVRGSKFAFYAEEAIPRHVALIYHVVKDKLPIASIERDGFRAMATVLAPG